MRRGKSTLSYSMHDAHPVCAVSQRTTAQICSINRDWVSCSSDRNNYNYKYVPKSHYFILFSALVFIKKINSLKKIYN